MYMVTVFTESHPKPPAYNTEVILLLLLSACWVVVPAAVGGWALYRFIREAMKNNVDEVEEEKKKEKGEEEM